MSPEIPSSVFKQTIIVDDFAVMDQSKPNLGDLLKLFAQRVEQID